MERERGSRKIDKAVGRREMQKEGGGSRKTEKKGGGQEGWRGKGIRVERQEGKSTISISFY